jgi:hypothetical protein
MPDEQPSTILRRLIDGHKATQAIHAAAELGLADLLAGGARTAADLAAATETHEPSLARLLHVLATLGVLDQTTSGAFAVSEIGEGLRSDAAEPLAAWARFCGAEETQRVWGGLLHSIRTGESAFPHVHGADAWEYRAAHPEAAGRFDAAMTDLSRRTSRALLDAYDFSRFGTVVDVGGGRGALLAALLAAHPRMEGILFDLPPVVATAHAVPERWRAEAGSFFDAVPSGGDAYVLRAVLHDWPDEECVRILEVCRAAMRQGVALLVIERDLADGHQETALSDLNMLVGPGGRERTAAHYRELLDRAGFDLVGVTPIGAAGLHVFEGRAR